MDLVKSSQYKKKDKKNIKCVKINKNTFKLESLVENNNLFLEKLLNFDIIQLFYTVNIQYFEAVDFKLINENEAILFILMKPLFKQLGYENRYVNLKITKTIENEKNVLFTAFACEELSEKAKKNPSAVPSPLQRIDIVCNIVNPHLIHIQEILTFDDTYTNYTIFEKLVAPILKIIFKQTIQAVEKINN